MLPKIFQVKNLKALILWGCTNSGIALTDNLYGHAAGCPGQHGPSRFLLLTTALFLLGLFNDVVSGNPPELFASWGNIWSRCCTRRRQRGVPLWQCFSHGKHGWLWCFWSRRFWRWWWCDGNTCLQRMVSSDLVVHAGVDSKPASVSICKRQMVGQHVKVNTCDKMGPFRLNPLAFVLRTL